MGARKSATRREPWPLPIATLFTDPAWRSWSCAARGMAISILEHYWMTECRPLPTDRNQLFAIARGHPRTWRAYRDEIMRLVTECLPDLDAYRRQRLAAREGLRIVQRRAADAAIAKRAGAKLDLPRASFGGPAHVTGELPRTQPPAPARPREDRPKGGFVG
jgi:hypothetical protein